MNAITSLIALAITGLVAAVMFEIRPLPAPPEPAVRPASAGAVPPVPEGPDAAISGRAAVLDTLLGRPLFSHTRRPPDVASPAAAAADPAASLPRMTAILIDGPHRSAIFAPPGGTPIRVAEGGRVGPFTIQSIEPQQVIVLGPEGKRIVRTSFDPNPPAPVPPLSATLPIPPRFPGIAFPDAAPNPPPFAPAASVGYGAAR